MSNRESFRFVITDVGDVFLVPPPFTEVMNAGDAENYSSALITQITSTRCPRVQVNQNLRARFVTSAGPHEHL